MRASNRERPGRCWYRGALEVDSEIHPTRTELRLMLLAEELGISIDLLEWRERPTVRLGTPASWADMLALGLHPETGEAL